MPWVITYTKQGILSTMNERSPRKVSSGRGKFLWYFCTVHEKTQLFSSSNAWHDESTDKQSMQSRTKPFPKLAYIASFRKSDDFSTLITQRVWEKIRCNNREGSGAYEKVNMLWRRYVCTTDFSICAYAWWQRRHQPRVVDQARDLPNWRLRTRCKT